MAVSSLIYKLVSNFLTSIRLRVWDLNEGVSVERCYQPTSASLDTVAGSVGMNSSMEPVDPLHKGGVVVITDMVLALTTIITNLMVVTGIKEQKTTIGMVHLVLGNLCLSNLLSAVLVKSISIVHHGYVVAANTTKSSVAFCSILTISYRTTWAALPWTIVTLSWIVVVTFVKETLVRITSLKLIDRSTKTQFDQHCYW